MTGIGIRLRAAVPLYALAFIAFGLFVFANFTEFGGQHEETVRVQASAPTGGTIKLIQRQGGMWGPGLEHPDVRRWHQA